MFLLLNKKIVCNALINTLRIASYNAYNFIGPVFFKSPPQGESDSSNPQLLRQRRERPVKNKANGTNRKQ